VAPCTSEQSRGINLDSVLRQKIATCRRYIRLVATDQCSEWPSLSEPVEDGIEICVIPPSSYLIGTTMICGMSLVPNSMAQQTEGIATRVYPKEQRIARPGPSAASSGPIGTERSAAAVWRYPTRFWLSLPSSAAGCGLRARGERTWLVSEVP